MEDSLAHLLVPTRVNLLLRGPTKTVAISDVAAQLTGHPAVRDPDLFRSELLRRDEASSTCAGDGIAFPHARTDAVSEIVLAVGRIDPPVDFAGMPVRLLFVIGTPRSLIAEYLALMGTLVRRLKRPGMRAALLEAASPEEFVGQMLSV